MKKLFVLAILLFIVACAAEQKSNSQPTTVLIESKELASAEFVSELGCQNGKIHLQLSNPSSSEMDLNDVIFAVNQRQDVDPGCAAQSLSQGQSTECLSIDNNGEQLSGKVSLVVDSSQSSMRTEVDC